VRGAAPWAWHDRPFVNAPNGAPLGPDPAYDSDRFEGPSTEIGRRRRLYSSPMGTDSCTAFRA
jgi:hypothetical protein